MHSLRIATSSSPTSSREDNTQDDDHQPTLTLGVEVTGYDLLTTGVTLAIIVPKAVYAYKGQSLIATTFDLVGGFATILLSWLKKAERPELFPCFFQVDLAPPILKFLRRPEVHLWFLSTLLFMITAMHLRATLDARRNYEHASDIPVYVIKDVVALSALALVTAICIFCMQCVRVIWPRVYRGGMCRGALFTINGVMFVAYYLYVMRLIRREEDYPPSIVKTAMHNVGWMFPFALLPYFDQFLDTHGVYSSPLGSKDLMLAGYFFLTEAVISWVWGFPDFPECLYSIFFSFFVVVFFSCRFFASIPTSWVPSLANIWSSWNAWYDRVWSAAN